MCSSISLLFTSLILVTCYFFLSSNPYNLSLCNLFLCLHSSHLPLSLLLFLIPCSISSLLSLYYFSTLSLTLNSDNSFCFSLSFPPISLLPLLSLSISGFLSSTWSYVRSAAAFCACRYRSCVSWTTLRPSCAVPFSSTTCCARSTWMMGRRTETDQGMERKKKKRRGFFTWIERDWRSCWCLNMDIPSFSTQLITTAKIPLNLSAGI